MNFDSSWKGLLLECRSWQYERCQIYSVRLEGTLCIQDRSQTMNAVVAATSSVGAYAYIRLYASVILLYMYCVCRPILQMHKRKKCLCQDHK